MASLEGILEGTCGGGFGARLDAEAEAALGATLRVRRTSLMTAPMRAERSCAGMVTRLTSP
jgi:hypothetical protein